MNQTWLNFLTTQHAVLSDNNEIVFPTAPTSEKNALYPISHLAVLKVSGNDATQFLQGQLTCNVKELSEQNSFFAGFCNAKGRVITTLLILKQADVLLLILPTVLLEKVQKKLQMYILRSKVQLANASDEYCLSGFTCSEEMLTLLALPELNFARNETGLKLSNRHYLVINNVEESINRWTELLSQGFQPQNSHTGQYLDLNAGLAWLDDSNSEEYIPQMLNLDKLGGISLTKGCYTGQEVVARTHYLGKSKRALFLAECAAEVIFNEDTSVIDETGQGIGKVLTWQQGNKACRLLIVMQTDNLETTELRLNNAKQDKISLIPFVTI